MPARRVSPTTPTTVSHGPSLSGPPNLNRFPSGSSCGQYVRAVVSLMMATRGLSEADAYALLRKTAMNQNRKISEIAESLITAAGLLAPPEES